jgi:hypothetical protein
MADSLHLALDLLTDGGGHVTPGVKKARLGWQTQKKWLPACEKSVI